MRAGACAAQQTLSAEAAAVLKHSLSLARRRGHAQVTPLHVAATLLTSRASLLRRACLKSQPHHQPSHHPLQCRALELCFNVALNRLPATPGPLLHAQPSLSNALIAALKRAQAHQRRGCIEQQQQQQQPPLIAIKVELEQLILSILDDPSVSRVMREAGFSSTAVKNNLDDCNTSVFQCYNASGGIYSTPSSPPAADTHQRPPLINPTALWQAHFLSHSSNHHSPFLFSPQNKPSLCMSDDIKLLLEVMVGRRRRNTVVVGDDSSTAEALVAQLMTLVEKGDVPDELKAAQVVKFQFSSVPLVLMNKDEVAMNVADLKRKVDSFASVGRVIVYIGDLKWTVDQTQTDSGEFCAVDYLIAEIGKLLAWYNASNMKVWLMATANYQTYVKCQIKQPPLDLQWSLQAVSVPSGGLGLSLNAASSGRDSRIAFSENSSPVSDKKVLCLKEETDVVLTCCQECTSDYEKEAALRSVHHKSFSDRETASPHLPYWLKPHANQTLEKEDLDQLRSKYNKLCQNLHQGSQNRHSSSAIFSSNQGHLGRNHYHTSSYPSWLNKNNINLADSETISFAYPAAAAAVKPNNQVASTLPRFRRQQSCHIEFSFSNGSSKNRSEEPNLDSLKLMEDKEVKITLALGSSYTDQVKHDKTVLSDLLKQNLPWQSEAIPSVVEALMSDEGNNNHDKFLLIHGNDNVAKKRLALAAAESFSGSSNLLLCMNMRNNDKTTTEHREILERALRSHERLVVLVEDVEFADPELARFLADALEAGKFEILGRNGKDSGRAVIILTADSDTNASYNTNSVMKMKLVVQESTFVASELPNLDHKRRAEWDSPGGRGRSKSRRSNEMEEVSSNATAQLLKRQLSSNGLDLNIRAADEDEAKEGNLSPISSDLTREITMEPPHNSLTFLKKIKNRFVLNRGSDQDREAREMLLSKFKRAFDEASTGSLKVEDEVLEKVLRGSGLYLNSSFGKWLKDIFQTSLGCLNSREREREKVSVRLCLVGEREGESCAEDGFMGTCLPKRIPVSYIG